MRHFALTTALLATAGVAFAQETKTDRAITVTGTATVYAKPDTARVHYGVRVSEPSADAVKDVLTKTTTAIDESIKKLKLTNLKITTAPITIHHSQGNGNLAVPVPGGAPGGGAGPGFVGGSSHTATFTDSDPEKLRAAVDSFIKAITEAGANTSGDELKEMNFADFIPGQRGNDGPKVVLSRADESAAHEEALQKAVENALRHAKAIAKTLGNAQVKVISVTDAEPEKSAQTSFNIYGVGDQSATTRSPAGEVEVKVRVIVKCAFWGGAD